MAMVDAQPPAFPVMSAMRLAKAPPLVHPKTLEAAARLCARFGGNREALDAAALAGSLIQANLLHAQKEAAGAAAPCGAGALAPPAGAMPPAAAPAPLGPAPPGLLNPPGPRAALPPQQAGMGLAAPAPAPCAVEAAPPSLSAQAKQAKAAAQATNNAPEDLSRSDHAQGPRPGISGRSAGGTQEFAASETLPSLPMPLPMGSMAPMAFMPQTMLQHPMMVAMATPPVTRPSQVRQPPAREPPPQRDPPRPVKVKPSTPAKEESREERPDEKVEKKPVAEEDQEPVRCHLHRKPQMNCKICRRLYFSALDPSMQKKDDRGKDKLASDRARRMEDDIANGRRRGAEAFEITNKQTFNFNTMLRDQILKNTYFKSLVNIETFEGIVDEMYQYAESAEVYGAGTTTVPSTLFCCLFRLFTIGISYDELQQLLETRDWSYIRCCGFLYIRFGCAPEKLWDQLGDYCLDDQEFEPSKAQSFTISIGEYVEALLMDERYYYTTLPRIPVGVKKKIEERVAPLSQYRKRTAANRKVLHLFREPGTPVEACLEGGWREGVVVQLLETFPTRLMVRVRFEDGTEDVSHLGKVILCDDRRGRRRSRSRSRSPRRAHSPDWTHHRGKNQEEMLQELRARQRERAVCSSGKDYARKPIGFMSGLALKRDVGVASTRLREEETYAPRQVEHRRQMTEEEEMERRKEERDKQVQDREKQRQLQQLFEHYGTGQPARPGASEQPLGVEEPEVLRLG